MLMVRRKQTVTATFSDQNFCMDGKALASFPQRKLKKYGSMMILVRYVTPNVTDRAVLTGSVGGLCACHGERGGRCLGLGDSAIGPQSARM